MSDSSLKKAMDFLENETQFHLGFLPTEQSSPLTRTLDQDFARSSVNGVKSLQRVDRNVLAMARRVFPSKEYARLVEGGERTLRSGGRIVFSGCGATGRSRWRPGRAVRNSPPEKARWSCRRSPAVFCSFPAKRRIDFSRRRDMVYSCCFQQKHRSMES